MLGVPRDHELRARRARPRHGEHARAREADGDRDRAAPPSRRATSLRAEQRVAQREHRWPPHFGVGAEPAQQRRVDRLGDRDGLGRYREVALELRRDDRADRAPERPHAIQRLVQRHAERVLIAASVGPGPGVLLRRHVQRRADHGTALGHPAALRLVRRRREQIDGQRARGSGSAGAREPEVADPYPTVATDEDVGGLEVAMDDPLRMRGVQAGRRVGEHRDHISPGALGRCEPAREIDAVDELHHHEHPGGAVLERVAADVEHLHDVGMGQPGERPRLAGEPLGARGGGPLHQLDRDVAAELGVVRPPHLAHRTRAEDAIESVPRESPLGHGAAEQRRAGTLGRALLGDGRGLAREQAGEGFVGAPGGQPRDCTPKRVYPQGRGARPRPRGAGHCVSSLNSMRRFLALPAFVLLGAIGSSGPAPRVSMRLASTPASVRYFFTEAARRADRSTL